MTTSTHQRLGFLGGGQMATALARGAIAAQILTADLLDFCEPNDGQRQKLLQTFGECQVTESANSLFNACPRVILAVKPQILRDIVGSIRPLVQSEHLIISILAGVQLDTLCDWLGTERVIRVMPNTPCQVLSGASGMTAGRGATDDDIQWAEKLMRSVGVCVPVTDQQLHAVTGLSGSGPAYVLTLIESLCDAGVAAGLPRETSMTLALQTVLGTAKMLEETKLHPAILREQVTSPAGTTMAGLRSLERHNFRSAIIEAVLAATHRSQELSAAR